MKEKAYNFVICLILESIINSSKMDNCAATLKFLLVKLNIQFTNSFIQDNILSHPEHPSLLCISDTLTKYQIENLAVKIEKEKLKELPFPCIVQLSNRGGMFHVLMSYSEEEVIYLNERGKSITIETQEFLKKWTGICLLVETGVNSSEPDIEKKLAERNITITFKWVGILFFLLWVVLRFMNSSIGNDLSTLSIGGYVFLKVAGLAMGTMLLWYEVDKYNPTLRSFCTGSKNINCDSVLNSKYAKILGGRLSLGLIGFTYFFGTLIFLFIDGFSKSSLVALAYMSYAAIPIVILSAYYQGKVIKQWCKFCLVIQAVLLMEALIAFLGEFNLAKIEIGPLSLLLALLLVPIPIWKWLKPLLEKEKETNLYKRSLKKVKSNHDVFEGLLNKTKAIKYNTEGLGITFKNTNAKYDVIKVCNPYCGPCSKAHPILGELFEQGKINLQILFTSSVENEDRRAKPVRHFLAIDTNGDKERTKKALHDWYSSENKDYESFKAKYPMNGELILQNEKIAEMRQWCDKEEISVTPTIFINGRELPNEYEISDLIEVLI